MLQQQYLFIIYILSICGLCSGGSESEKGSNALLESLMPHYEFDCDPEGYSYETEFEFLKGLGRGFVHAEPFRIFFEYYFPAEHWVGFASADQSIATETDHCTQCYFNSTYPQKPSENGNWSNLYPQCIEECLDDAIFVATVNSDEENINDWNLIEFQISYQVSEKLNKKMYRIPKPTEILELWGSQLYPYRQQAHFESDIMSLQDGTEYVHAKFWRRYDFAPDESIDEYDESNEWKIFTMSPEGNDAGLAYDDSLCFISIASYFGGEYPYDNDATGYKLPGFYIDSERLSNIYCFKLKNIIRDCGQDWSFLTETVDDEIEDIEGDTDNLEEEEEDDDTYYEYDDDNAGDDDMKNVLFENTKSIDSDVSSQEQQDISTTKLVIKPKKQPENKLNIDERDEITDEPSVSPTVNPLTVIKTNKGTTPTTTTTTTTKKKISTTKPPTIQPKHGEDCCSAISGISYDDINCLNISQSKTYIHQLENRWKTQECGRPNKLPIDLNKGIENSRNNDSDCDHLWAFFNQIHEICYKYKQLTKSMAVYNYFKTRGGYECFDIDTDECKIKEREIANLDDTSFGNFNYDDIDNNDNNDNDDVDTMIDEYATSTTTKAGVSKKGGEDSELAEMEEDGGLTITTLGFLGLIIMALGLYVLYWFCCSATSKGYKQQMMYDGGYYDDDIDTDEYISRKQIKQYNERINGGYNNNNYNDDDEEDGDSDWSVDEQLDAGHGNNNDDNDDYDYNDKKKKKNKKKKKKNKKKNKNTPGGYDISVNDVNSMPISQHYEDDDDEEEFEEDHDERDKRINMNDAVEVRVDSNNNNNDEDEEEEEDDDDDYYDEDEENETLQNEQQFEDDK